MVINIANPIPDEEQEEETPTFEHGIICSRLNRHLGNFLDGKNLGEMVDSTPEYRFLDAKTNKKPGRYPDVSFVSKEKLPINWRTYPNIAPDLAIEVTSPSDKDYEIEAKVAEYLRAGVNLVWVIHPFSRTIDVYQLPDGLIRQTLGGNSELDGAPVLPGFKLAISKIFDYPPPPSDL